MKYKKPMKPLIIIGRNADWDAIPKVDAFERWTVSSAYFDHPKETASADKIFQIHRPSAWETDIEDVKAKLVIAWDMPRFEDCERLPVKALLAEFGPVFPSSVNWMLAYALYLGYDNIILEGMDMKHDTEYGAQRDGLFYLLGVAWARGVKVLINPTSGIYMAPVVYGVEAK